MEMVLLMEFRSAQGMERLRPQQDGMVISLVVVVGVEGILSFVFEREREYARKHKINLPGTPAKSAAKSGNINSRKPIALLMETKMTVKCVILQRDFLGIHGFHLAKSYS
jgi:hypothetical protein